MCQNPLDMYMTTDVRNIYFIRDICSFSRHKPIDFTNNLSIYKTNNGRAYKYCFSCHTAKLPNLQNREIGIRAKPVSRSLSLTEAYSWCSDFSVYLNRSDVDDCVVRSVRTEVPNGLGVMLTATELN
jgi:hypothetical protein